MSLTYENPDLLIYPGQHMPNYNKNRHYSQPQSRLKNLPHDVNIVSWNKKKSLIQGEQVQIAFVTLLCRFQVTLSSYIWLRNLQECASRINENLLKVTLPVNDKLPVENPCTYKSNSTDVQFILPSKSQLFSIKEVTTTYNVGNINATLPRETHLLTNLNVPFQRWFK